MILLFVWPLSVMLYSLSRSLTSISRHTNKNPHGSTQLNATTYRKITTLMIAGKLNNCICVFCLFFFLVKKLLFLNNTSAPLLFDI